MHIFTAKEKNSELLTTYKSKKRKEDRHLDDKNQEDSKRQKVGENY